jgi:hypothetical protein
MTILHNPALPADEGWPCCQHCDAWPGETCAVQIGWLQAHPEPCAMCGQDG